MTDPVDTPDEADPTPESEPDQPAVYANELGERTTHLFRGNDVRAATLSDGFTDEPVRSICGLVSSYGEFTAEVPTDRCKSCASKCDTTTTND